MLDADLARYYGVGTRDLNKAVGRNLARFPEDFAFTLTREETRALMFQTGTSKADPGLIFQSEVSKPGRGGTRKSGERSPYFDCAAHTALARDRVRV